MAKRRAKKKTLDTDVQRKALASAIRMELLGNFVEGQPLSVSDLAERMGRPAAAIHYHVKILREAGLLFEADTRRSGSRTEILYAPEADMFAFEQPGSPDEGTMEAARKTLASAFRMAEKDFASALDNPHAAGDGKYRNIFGARLHCRLSKGELAELNKRLREIERFLADVHRNHKPSPNDRFVSLTIALMPLRNREVSS